MEILNYTPHTVDVYDKSGNLAGSFPSDGAARCAVITEEIGHVEKFPLFRSTYGEVTGLPPFDPHRPARIIIVSLLVRQALPGRPDLYSPGELLRDGDGNPIGCIGLTR